MFSRLIPSFGHAFRGGINRNALLQPVLHRTSSSPVNASPALYALCHNGSGQRTDNAVHTPSKSKVARKSPTRKMLDEPRLFEGAKAFSTSPAILYDEESQEDASSELVQQINTQVTQRDTGRLFAVIHIGRNQRKITSEDIVVINKHYAADVGERVVLNKVLLVGSRDFTLVGKPLLSPNVVRVEATVIEKTLSHTIIRFWYRRRRRYRRFKLKKLALTYLRINSIELNPLQKPSV